MSFVTGQGKRLSILTASRSLKFLVFDLDGTLVTLRMPWPEWIDEVAGDLTTEQAVSLRAEIYAGGRAWGAYLNTLIAEGAITADRIVGISAWFESKYYSQVPNNDLLAALSHLRASGVALYLWTSNTRPTAERALEDTGVRQLFTALATREDSEFGKPHPQGWSVLFPDGVPLHRCLLVGDSMNDEAAARSIGVDYFKVVMDSDGQPSP